MQDLPDDIYSVASVREIDRSAIEDHGIPGYTLMTRAGAAAVRAARERFPDTRRWQVIAGAGNNAGDGYVVARLAAADGIAVSVLALVESAALTGDAATACADFAAEGGLVIPWSGELDAEADLLIDAILGSGLGRDVDGDFAAAVAAINAHPAAVLALDIPTGIDGNSGAILGCAVKADLTTTFVALQAGLFLGEAPNHCGEITFSGLDIPDDCRAGVIPELRRIDDDLVGHNLPPRRRAAHKGDFGHVLVVGGGPGMPGAAQLCGMAALRAGAGRVSIATDTAHAAAIAAARPELMAHGVDGAAALEALLERVDVIAFGPGLGQSAWAQELYDVLVADGRPAVWDADALNILAAQPAVAEHRIVTPHAGEAAALLGLTAAEIQADRTAALQALASKYGGVTVLKGAGTLICSASGAPLLCSSGNPGMAAPGMGDVLTGVIAALLAQGLGAAMAAAVGVAVHARAGDRAALAGQRGMIATDLLDELRAAVNP